MHSLQAEDVMADHINDPERRARSGDSNDPGLPPRVMTSKKTINSAFWSYMGPVLALFVVFGIALLYWMNHHPATHPDDEGQTIGTSGEAAGERRDGGSDPAPRADSTKDEIQRRGGDTK
jgi:hypothetical protein